MRILDKYIAKNFISSFFYCLILFSFLYIVIDLFGHLDEILKNHVPIVILLQYYISMIPIITMQVSPVASLISTIYIIGSMNKHDEIIAMRATGISMFRILMPFIFIGLAISIVSFAISEKFLPEATKNVTSIKENYIEKERTDKTKHGSLIYNIALYGKNNRLIFIENYDKAAFLATGITILHQDKKGNVIAKTNAQEGKWTESGWEFVNILRYKLDKNSMVTGRPLFFERENIDMEGPEELISKGTNCEFMSFKNLLSYIDNFKNTSPGIITKLRVDLHQKISFPFINLVLILIGACSSLKIKHRGKKSAVIGIGMAIVIGFLYYAFMAMCIALGKGGILPPILSAHLANIVFASFGIILIKN